MKAKFDCPACGRRATCECEPVVHVFPKHEEYHAPSEELGARRERTIWEHRIALREIERNKIEELRAIRRERREGIG
jgi:hypothetical protein